MKFGRVMALACAVSGVTTGVACSVGGEEDVGSQAARLVSTAPTNYKVSGSFIGRHETATTYAEGNLPSPGGGHHVGGWLTTWNTATSGRGWATSLDADGVSWAANELASNANPLSWGDPGGGKCDASYLTAWSGDPSVAPDYNPATNNSATRVFFTNIGSTAVTFAEGALISYSDNGGQTWQGASWVDDPTSCGTATGIVDDPFIASNPQPPYDTWVAWDDTNDGNHPGRLQRVWWDPPPPPPATSQLHKAFPQALVVPDGGLQRHRIAFGKMPTPCTTGQEAVFVVMENGVSGNRCYGATQRGSVSPQWSVNVFDTGSGKFLLKTGAQVIASVTGGPDCLTDQFQVYNQPDPSIAADPLSSDFWVAMTTVKNGSNRIRIQGWTMVCNHGKGEFRQRNDWTTPDPCDLNELGQCTFGVLPDGGIALQDEWQPAIGYAVHQGMRTLVAYWYGTRDDINNHMTRVYSSYTENGGTHWTDPVAIAIADPGTMIPWDPYASSFQRMWDYNTLGVDAFAGRFLAVWGGDNRTPGSGTIESELLY